MFPGLPKRDERWALGRREAVGLLVLFGLALGLRLGVILNSAGGLGGNLGDDAAAYYAGADAMVHGRLPYQDFVLLHPPLLDLLLTPFALLGAVTTDHLGFMTATVAMQVMGAVSAVLVVLVARRFGLGRAGAFAGGVFYAVWYGAVSADSGIRLENAGTFVSLLGLLALTSVSDAHPRRGYVLGGVAFGAAAGVKIWGSVPVLVLLLWCLARRRTRPAAAPFAAGAAAALVVVCGPFFLAAPRTMWHMVVLDQLGRTPNYRDRLRSMIGLRQVFPHLTGHAYQAVTLLVLVLLVATFLLAVRVRATLPVVLLAVAELFVLAVSPSFFTNYSGFVAGALALTVGAAAHSAVGTPHVALRKAGVGALALLVAGAVVMSATSLLDAPPGTWSRPFPDRLMADAVHGARCPVPDGPIVLIETNTLSDTLGRGCRNWIDVTGKLYTEPGPKFPRSKNRQWQRDLRSYLLSGEVVILFRPMLGVGPELRHEIERLPLIGTGDGYAAYRVR